MRTRSHVSLVLAVVVGVGCSPSKPPEAAPAPPADSTQPAASQDAEFAGTAETDEMRADDAFTNRLPVAENEQRFSGPVGDPPSDPGSSVPASAESASGSATNSEDSSLDGLIDSVGRVLTGRPRGSDAESDETTQHNHSVFRSVRRALSKAAAEAAQHGPLDNP